MLHSIEQSQDEALIDVAMELKRKLLMRARLCWFSWDTFRAHLLHAGIQRLAGGPAEEIQHCCMLKVHFWMLSSLFDVFLKVCCMLCRTLLADIILAVHVFLKIFELHYSVQGAGVKLRKRRRKRKTGARRQVVDSVEATEEHPEATVALRKESWDALAPDLSAVLQGHVDLPENVVPFDMLAEHGVDEKYSFLKHSADAVWVEHAVHFRIVAQIRIQRALQNGCCDEAVALVKASRYPYSQTGRWFLLNVWFRDLWPEDLDVFGTDDLLPEDEFLLLRHIFFSNLPG